jgi:AcrR family transcriptional regulator
MGAKKTTATRLSREQWLERALDVLAKEGSGNLGIQYLSSALGVSRGSFYWHFRDRAAFVQALLDYWHEIHTVPIPALVNAGGGTPRVRFKRLCHAVVEQKLVRFDMPVRVWAAREPEVAALVARTDHYRLEFVRGLFSEMGFKGSELDIRARGLIAYLTMEGSLFDPVGELSFEQNLDELCHFFTGEY